MVKLPKKIKIGGHWFQILYPYNFSERNDITGLCDFPMKTLMVAASDDSGNALPDSSIMVTAIHEILHGIDYVSGANVFNGNEAAISNFSEVTYQVLVDNFKKLLPR